MGGRCPGYGFGLLDPKLVEVKTLRRRSRSRYIIEALDQARDELRLGIRAIDRVGGGHEPTVTRTLVRLTRTRSAIPKRSMPYNQPPPRAASSPTKGSYFPGKSLRGKGLGTTVPPMTASTANKRGRGRERTALDANQRRALTRAVAMSSKAATAEAEAAAALVEAHSLGVPVSHLAEEFEVTAKTIRNRLKAAGVTFGDS